MEQHWYAIYTKNNAEKTLRECISHFSRLHALPYETFLPLRNEIKQWRDRTKVKKLPLFKNYLFVKHDDNAFHHIKTMKGFCDYVRFGLTPSTIPTQQMEMIKKIAEFQTGAQCQTGQLVKGKKVTGFTNGEEAAVGLTKIVPFLIEDMLIENGALYNKGADWSSFAVSDGLLISGQNPQSAGLVAEILIEKIKTIKHVQ